MFTILFSDYLPKIMQNKFWFQQFKDLLILTLRLVRLNKFEKKNWEDSHFQKRANNKPSVTIVGPPLLFFYGKVLEYDSWGGPSYPVSRIRIRSDPYHLVGSGSVSGSVDMDRGSAKGLLRQKVYIFKIFIFLLNFARFRNI